MVRFLLLSALFESLYGAFAAESEQGGRKLSVKLHKQLVPVRNGDKKIVAYKSAYFGTIFVGGPLPQEFSVVFDTGSGHVVLPSAECNSMSCMIHRRYKREDSAEAQEIDFNGEPAGEARDAITIAFGTGEVTGEFVRDKVCLPQSDDEDALLAPEVPKVASTDCFLMHVVSATEMSKEPFSSFSFDGVLGLGLESLAIAPQFSFFGRMVADGRLGAPEFAVFLAEDEDEESEITFGGYNPEHLRGELTWAPVALPDHGHWQVEILGIHVDGIKMPWCSSEIKCRGVVDTGTSLLAAPKNVQPQLQESLGTEISGTPPACKQLRNSLLEFELMGGFRVKLAVKDLVHSPVQMPAANKTEVFRNVCVPNIMPLQLPEPLGPHLYILGEPVLRKYYTVYNWERKEIGFGAVPPVPEKDESTFTVIV